MTIADDQLATEPGPGTCEMCGGAVARFPSSAGSSQQLVWRDPPGDRRLLLTPTVVAALREHPERWAIVRVYASRRTAAKYARDIKRPVDIEVRGVEEPPGSALYARAVPGRRHGMAE